ncbi:LytTR family DNA-binding domain-containing protein [Caulobacter mirabilis]|uniref:HTH LytTR-type domain-containing protein n=1 Tax=Caulobacter mirabilis TaxID=69666 RepID=A0A2D2AUB3_9CAUL|nr:LytTR family DNA-binding domain-containing protein [Caulobacter mirabilis]ATQ41598.1 hypothetical protein CSW64_03805 [Caulobacter mirabilis]
MAGFGAMSRGALTAGITAGAWAAYYASRLSGALFDFGATRATACLALALAVACLFAAGMCLGLDRLMTSLTGRSLALRLTLAIVLTNLAAIAWTIANRLVLYPAAEGVFSALGLVDGSFAAGAMQAHDSTFVVWLVFLAWAGLRLALDGAATRTEPAYDDELWAVTGREAIRLPLADVLWFEAEGDYMRAHRREGRPVLMREPMHALMKRLDPERFLRIHRSTIVALAAIEQVRRRGAKGLEVALAGGVALPVGRSYQPLIRRISASRS